VRISAAWASGCCVHGNPGGFRGCAGGNHQQRDRFPPAGCGHADRMAGNGGEPVDQRKRPLSAVSRRGMSSHSSRWTATRCTLTPGRASSAAIRPGSSASAFREYGHHPPSTCHVEAQVEAADAGPRRRFLCTKQAVPWTACGPCVGQIRPVLAAVTPLADLPRIWDLTCANVLSAGECSCGSLCRMDGGEHPPARRMRADVSASPPPA
jgi:hypothetical protein